MKFKIYPAIREKSTISADLCVFDSLKMIKEEYLQKFKEIGIDLDLSLMEKEELKDGMPWYFNQFGEHMQKIVKTRV